MLASDSSSSASRRCRTLRERTPTSRAAVDDRHALGACSSRKRKASLDGHVRPDRQVRLPRRSSGVAPGSSPSAITSRTSVFRVTTPTSRRRRGRTRRAPRDAQSSLTRRLSGRVRQLHPRFEIIASRTTVTGRSLARRGRPQLRGSRRRAPRCGASHPFCRRAPRPGRTRSCSFSASLRGSRRASRRADRGPAPTRSSETVTPPAFVSTSGSTGIPRSPEDRVRLERRRARSPPRRSSARGSPRCVLGRDLILAGRRARGCRTRISSSSSFVSRGRRRAAVERAVLGDVGGARRDVEAVAE